MSTLQFDHIALECNDIPETLDFYRQAFEDIEVLYQDATWALIEAGGTKIAFVSPGEHPPHSAFRVECRTDLEQLANLYGKKIKLHRDNSESFYFSDPSGNTVEIVWYP